MLKETLLPMLFIGAVVLAGYFLKNNNIGTTKSPDTMVQASGSLMDDERYPYTADASPVTDTLNRK
jgi:hypothetical protein